MKSRYTTDNYFKKINGARLYMLRKKHNITQNTLAKKLGITFQQIQKYEWGQNAISSNAMYQFAKMFDVEMEYFFRPLNQIEYFKKNVDEGKQQI